MYPLKNWKSLPRGYRFKERTWYTLYHLGLDLITPTNTPVYAPFDGKIIQRGYNWILGNYVYFKPSNASVVMRLLHFVKTGHAVGSVKKSAVIGYVGSTGLSTGSHLHIDISKGKTAADINIYNINNFLDPEKYPWNPPTDHFKVRVLRPSYVRSQPRLSAPLSGSKLLRAGFVFDGVAVVVGDKVGNNNKWVKSASGRYVWSGNLSY